MMTSTFRAEASNIYLALRQQHADCWTKLESVSWRLDNAVVGASQTLLNTVLAVLGKLGPTGSMTLAVDQGTRTPAQWQSLADTARESLNACAKNIGEALPTWQRLTDEVLMPTVTEVRAEVTKVASSAADLVPWIAAALIALVMGYVIFSFRRV